MMKKKQIPLTIKSFVAVRDNGVCQICGKFGILRPTYFGLMAFERAKAWQRKKGEGCMSGIYPGYVQFEIDHILPESKGGDMELTNLQLVCRSCNRSKGNKYE